jgi:hypothetical protein
VRWGCIGKWGSVCHQGPSVLPSCGTLSVWVLILSERGTSLVLGSSRLCVVSRSGRAKLAGEIHGVWGRRVEGRLSLCGIGSKS